MQNNYNFSMPAEWEKHERTFIEWPVKSSLTWPENYKEVCEGYANAVKAISEFEAVTVIVNEDTQNEAKSLCGADAEFLTLPHNDAWVRDNGPTFVKNKNNELSAINWEFNAWGGKYEPFNLDNELPVKLLDYLNIPRIDANIVLEGGSIHADGEGTLLATEQCLLNSNRNPSISREQIEDTIKKLLNISKIIWLKNGLYGDETDGHVDNIACFAKTGTVLFQACYDPNDPNYEVTKENLEILNNTIDAKGRRLEIIEIPQPPVRFYNEKRLTLSYINFYYANNAVILPVFGGDAQETDKIAEAILQKNFPERKIVKINGIPLVKEGGNIHCITQQMPARD